MSKVLDSINVIVYVADLKTYEVLYINEYTREMFGNVKGKICWQTIQAGQTAPCGFCTNDNLIGPDGKPSGVYHWEFQNTVTGRWFDILDRAIEWKGGRIVRLEVATDITERKKAEEEREKLIIELRGALDEVKTLSGLLPICSSCQKIRDDKGYWNKVADYITTHYNVEFTHGLCPECAQKLYPRHYKS
ncbi:MAG: hypothetical protein C4581_04230 [Nitrospiraceae bacterium]|nr:MAG: hypothetical protein C4581_04230 [Nitrospiraceae bacterium]